MAYMCTIIISCIWSLSYLLTLRDARGDTSTRYNALRLRSDQPV